jgi:hypothetical protein
MKKFSQAIREEIRSPSARVLRQWSFFSLKVKSCEDLQADI